MRIPPLNDPRNVYRRLRRLKNELIGHDAWIEPQLAPKTMFLGSSFGGWTFIPELLSKDSTVYSFGVGRDVTFDLALIERFGLTVHAFDPTPLTVEWAKKQSFPPTFHFHEMAIGDFDGEGNFAQELDDPNWDTFILGGKPSPNGKNIMVPVLRLESIMKHLGHKDVDLVKMDIETSEFPVIQDMLRSTYRPKQFLIEIHYAPGNKPEIERLRKAAKDIEAMGYKLFHRSPQGLEFSYLHQG
jgi:FkbM family methyltransferase